MDKNAQMKARSPDGGGTGPLSFSQLAMAYAPEISAAAASNRLRQWLSINPQLMQSLRKAGYRDRQRVLTPRQVEVIYEYLGEP